jgi:hypothetical protein
MSMGVFGALGAHGPEECRNFLFGGKKYLDWPLEVAVQDREVPFFKRPNLCGARLERLAGDRSA